jgi:hypothetical protein
MTDRPTVEQQHVTLSPPIVAAIKLIASNGEIPPEHRLLSVLIMVYGYAWFDQQTTIDPRAIALPEAQWQEVAGFLMSGVPGDRIENVNLGLSWMNSGPSGYTD